jgi:hypothetical protein
MPKLSAPQFYVVTSDELAAKPFAFKRDDVIFNTDTGAIRMGPGTWDDCISLVAASVETTLIDDETWEMRRFKRTSGVGGLITFNLTALVPGISAVYYMDCVSTQGEVLVAANQTTDLNDYQVIVAAHETLEGVADKEVIITLAVQL